MERLREFRAELTQAEGDVSLVRRMAQGRLDIVGHEVAGRAPGGSGLSADPAADPAALLFDLPDILTDQRTGTAPSGRSAPINEPGALALTLIEALDGIISPSDLAGIAQVDGDGLTAVFEELQAFEVELSSSRRGLHDRIDAIQGEIARRYRDGEASVDALLG